MVFSGRFWHFLFLLMVSGTLAIPSQAQNNPSPVEANQRQAASHKDCAPTDEVELKVEQLQSLVEQQQRVLAAMEKWLKEVEEKNPSTVNAATNVATKPAPTGDASQPTKD